MLKNENATKVSITIFCTHTSAKIRLWKGLYSCSDYIAYDLIPLFCQITCVCAILGNKCYKILVRFD